MNESELSALDRAKVGLEFEDVYQLKTESWVDEEIDPKYGVSSEDIYFQLKHGVHRSCVQEVQLNGESENVFRVLIEVGVRFLKNELDQDDSIMAQIEASYFASYIVREKGLLEDQEALDIFALNNASYHVWPFWREFVMSQSQRMNLPKVSLPMRMVS